MAKPVLVVGSINMDLVGRCHHMPEPGQTIHGSGFLMTPGGKGANQAATVAKLGGSCRMVGRVGADLFGERTRENLSSFGVDTSFIRTDNEAATGVALILVDDAGENSIVVIRGANWSIGPEEVRAARAAIRQSCCVMAQLEIPMAAVGVLAETCWELNVPFILDPAPVPDGPIPEQVLRKTSILTPNEQETKAMVGTDVGTVDEAFAAGRKLRELGVGTAIVKLGARGSVIVGEIEEFVASKKVAAVDSTAAGDVFVGAIAVGLSEGLSIAQAVKFGSFAAALSVTRMGAQSSIPTRSELDRFIADMEL